MKWSRYNVWARAGARHYVHNGATGAFVDLDECEQEALVAVVERGADPPTAELAGTLADLVTKGVIVADSTDELSELEKRYLVHRRGGGSMSITVVASLGCNFDCPYCFEDKRPSILKPAVSDAIVEMVRASAHNLEHLDVTWFGGEPLLATPQVLELSERLARACADASATYGARIITNGWHLTPTVAADLAARGVTWAQITIDGPEHIHDRVRP